MSRCLSHRSPPMSLGGLPVASPGIASVRRRGFVSMAMFAAASVAAPCVLAQGKPEKSRVAIAVGGKAAFYYLPLTIAEQLGYFRAEGLDVEITDFAGGVQAIQAMVGGAADVVSGAYEHTISLQSRNQFYQAFVLQGRAPQIALGVSTKTMGGYKSLADLKGKKIGVTSAGSSTNLMANVAGKNKFEIYDYPGEYMQAGLGDQLARIRLEEQRAVTVKLRGDSNCRAFTSGYKFKLADHYRTDLNQEYLLTSVQHSASVGLNYSSGAGEEARYTNSFEGIPATQPYRPPRVTPQPLMQGCQTAVVVGPAGEEIYTDKYGRVKVQFHWDREGKKDQNSSCWVRVSSPWAGKGWGGLQVPRIGQEVIIDFLEGDPDQPLIVGRVYNAGQMPPFGLPGGAVISGFKSNSTKGGGGYNQISLDDTKGNELLHIHAQYDQDNKVLHDERTSVGNDRTESVGHDETITIGHDRKEKVGNNEDIAIGVNRTETVGSNETITIGVNRTESVGSNETISIGSNRTETVGASETVTVALMRTHNVGINDMLNVGAANEVTVGGLQAITVGATRAVTVGSSQTVTIASDHTVSIGSKQETTTGSDFNTTIGAKEKRDVSSDRTTNIGGKDTLDVGKSLHITAADEIVLETGASKITMKKDGKIEISGMNITIKGTTSIKEEAVSITIEASGINTIKGSLVKIN